MNLDKFDPDIREYARAFDILEKTANLNPEYDIDALLDFCNDLLKANPNDSFAYVLKSTYFQEVGDYDKAVECFDMAIQHSSGLITSMYLGMKSSLMYDLERDDEAAELAEKAIRQGHGNSMLFSIKGLVLHNTYNKSPDRNLAETILYYYDRALQDNDLEEFDEMLLNPKRSYSDQVLHNKGLLLFDLKKYDAAIECFEEELSIRPDNVHTLTNKATALHRIGKNKESRKCCRYLAKLDPQDPEILYSLCARFYSLELYDEALDTINTAINLDPFNPKGEKYRRVIESKLRSKNN